MPETVVDASIPEAIDQPIPVKANILLVEDDDAVRRYLEIILRRAGYAVICASDGLTAIKAALSSNPDAVVTDAIMPHLSGRELCRYLRSRPEFSRLPILLLTGLDQKNTPLETNAHADAHLIKPVRPEEFISCLARLLAAKN
ncbi:MAG: response regulator [Pyrinomonadaceae bacterium]